MRYFTKALVTVRGKLFNFELRNFSKERELFHDTVRIPYKNKLG